MCDAHEVHNGFITLLFGAMKQAYAQQALASLVVGDAAHIDRLRYLWRTDDLQALAAQRIVNVDYRIRPSLCQEVHQLHARKMVFVCLWCITHSTNALSLLACFNILATPSSRAARAHAAQPQERRQPLTPNPFQSAAQMLCSERQASALDVQPHARLPKTSPPEMSWGKCRLPQPSPHHSIPEVSAHCQLITVWAPHLAYTLS